MSEKLNKAICKLNKINGLFCKIASKIICKNILILVLFILPQRVLNTFITLNMLAVLYKLRNIEFKMENIQTKYLNKLLNIVISKEVLLLPEYTVNWLWNEKFLSRLIEIEGKKYKLCEVIINKELFNSNVDRVVDMFVQELPLLFKIKLNLNSFITKNKDYNCIIFKNSLINSIVY